MNSDIDWDLLGKYLFGECSEEEVAKIRVWIEEDPTREALLEELRQVLQATRDSGSSGAWNTTALWNRIRQQTRQQDPEGRSAMPRGERTPPAADRAPRRGRERRRPARDRAGLSFFSRQATWAGAVALMIVAMVLFWLQGERRAAPASEAKTFATQKGQRASLRLPDGTRVRLNVDSRLIVPATFGEESRAVHLEGEAFFEVAEDATRPFDVRAGGAVTRVLGTAFDVNAYPEDVETKVVVTEGRVVLRADGLPQADDPSATRGDATDVVLTKDQMGQVRRGGERVMRRELAVNHPHLAWLDGQLVFEKAPFSEVARKLERWYSITISLEDGTAPPSGRLNARFAEDQPLREVLSVAATAYGLDYERDKQRVIFTHAENKKARSP